MIATGATWAEGEVGSRGRVTAPDLELTVDQRDSLCLTRSYSYISLHNLLSETEDKL
jgi:hypothetical protein